MPTKEAVVVILDANESMATRVTPPVHKTTVDNDRDAESESSSLQASKTRFECAKEASIAIICDLMARSKTNEATVVVLHTETTKNYFYEEGNDNTNDDNDEKDDYCPFPGIIEMSGNGEVMGMRQPLPDLLRKIKQLEPTATTSRRRERNRHTRGDFESGLVYAADVLHRGTAGKKFNRRIVLLTDAEHKVGDTGIDASGNDSDSFEKRQVHGNNFSQQRLLVALDSLRAMDCRIEVVGMDFKLAADFDAPASGPSEIKTSPIEDGGDDSTDYDTDDGNGSSENESDSEDDDEEEDMLYIKQENEEYLIRLANTTGGFVYASEQIQDILQKVLGSRVVENPSKRKLIVEIAPGLVLEDARFYKLISKTASMPLKKKLVMVDQDVPTRGGSIEAKKNALGEEMLQDYETVNTRWNAEDENEELFEDQITRAYRFGSDLLPFSSLDEAGLKMRSPVKLTILGYVPESSVPHYLQIDSPYVLTGNESRRCCAAISALATGLHRQKKVAIATFVKAVDKDPILCGLFPLPEKEVREKCNSTNESSSDQTLRLIIMQLPFSGDVRYPHLELPESEVGGGNINDGTRTRSEICCDDLIDKLMLPKEILDYKYIPNHKVRSFYKTVVKRVLDKSCDVVPTRIDSARGKDSMDTPLEIRKRAQSAVEIFYDTSSLTDKTRGDRI